MAQGYVLAIHGGCENIAPERFTPDEERERLEALLGSLASGRSVLDGAGSALDAVEAAVKVLEDSPHFNAGRGSVFTFEGRNEMDAGIMSGETLQAGAVASTSSIKNPVAAARLVMEKTEHVLLVSAGAERFAEEQGLARMSPSYFYTPKRWEEYLQAHRGTGQFEPPQQGGFGTVGAVCLDGKGSLAAASSTGGTSNKLCGRLGDSPIIGAGVYANNGTCAVSCTGHGEPFMRQVAAHRISLLMELKGFDLEQAAAEALQQVRSLGGEGGLIAVDRKGRAALPFNTQGMFRGLALEGQPPRVALHGPPGSWAAHGT